MPLRLAWSRPADAACSRGICWYCARLAIRDVIVARQLDVLYTCGLCVTAPKIVRCAYFLREPGSDDEVLAARRIGRLQIIGVVT